MKTYIISTKYILSEFYAGLMAGIIQAIAGNCDARTVTKERFYTGYMLEPEKYKDRSHNLFFFKGHNLFVFKASKENKDKILEIAKTVFGDRCNEVSEVEGENERKPS